MSLKNRKAFHPENFHLFFEKYSYSTALPFNLALETTSPNAK